MSGTGLVIPFVSRIGDADAAAWLQALAAALPGHRVAPLAQLDAAERQAARVAIVANPDPRDLRSLPNLQWVQSLWAGVERLLAEDPQAAYAIVRMTDPQLARTMAEAVLAWVLYLHRDMPRYRQQQAARHWQPHELPLPSQRRIGILGLGHLGREAARVLVGQGFSVHGWTRSPTQVHGVQTFDGEAGLALALQRSDIVVVLLPLTAATRGLLDAQALAELPHGASLINFARGPIVDEAALLDRLSSGALAHVVLDVFEHEPLPAGSPLWAHPAVTVLPHISAPTNRSTASLIAADHIHRYLASGAVPPAVDRSRGY